MLTAMNLGAAALSPRAGSLLPASPAARSTLTGLRLDPNTATWWELAHLPGIGPARANAIVAWREAHRREDTSRTGAHAPSVFAGIEDLVAVPGIGQRTAERLAPFLAFPPSAAQTR